MSKKHALPHLSDLDMSPTLDTHSYTRQLAELQHKLMLIQQSYLFSGHSAVVVFEGWDAAGKGGAIRRMSAALDPRGFKVWPIGAPSQYYLQRHYLLRFFERLPPKGAITVFDRSWYGRVLVERVEDLTAKARWNAAYDEINAFEAMLANDGTRVIKIFMHISPQEQLKRFERRLLDPMKRWKLTYEDFRNRKRWDDYEAAVNDMFAKTSTKHAPWIAVPANNKKHARIAAIGDIVARLSHGIDLSPPDLDAAVLSEAANVFDLPEPLVQSLSGLTE